MSMHRSILHRLVFLLMAVCTALLCASELHAGGPLFVGGPGFGVDGQPFIWDPNAMPIKYRVDGGPMSSYAGATVIDNAAGLARVQAMFQTWQSVSTASLSFSNAGTIQPTSGFSDGDVSTAVELGAVFASCQTGAQSPVVFDADGFILFELGLDPNIIGFSSQCSLNSSGHIVSDLVLLNGAFQDGATSPQINANQFDQAITHEIGHLLGLDHSQANIDALILRSSTSSTCDPDTIAGTPLMFPFLFCPARADVGQPKLAPDDIAWISRLYPGPTYAANYTTISGMVFFSYGQAPVQGANVIARAVDNLGTPQDESRAVAISVVSGYRFTGNPGQTVTSHYLECNPHSSCPPNGFFDDNSLGSQFGSRNKGFIGAYDIPVPAPGTYTVEVEEVYAGFISGSSVGPLDPPISLPGLPEFWNAQESAHDDPAAFDPIAVTPNQAVTATDIILNGTPPAFDQFEDGGASLQCPGLVPWPWEPGQLKEDV